MANVDYKSLAEALIDQLLSDWLSCDTYPKQDDDIKHQKKRINRRLASLIHYDNLPITEIIRLAEWRNETFSFMVRGIDLDKLEMEIKEVLEDYFAK